MEARDSQGPWIDNRNLVLQYIPHWLCTKEPVNTWVWRNPSEPQFPTPKRKAWQRIIVSSKAKKPRGSLHHLI